MTWRQTWMGEPFYCFVTLFVDYGIVNSRGILEELSDVAEPEPSVSTEKSRRIPRCVVLRTCYSPHPTCTSVMVNVQARTPLCQRVSRRCLHRGRTHPSFVAARSDLQYSRSQEGHSNRADFRAQFYEHYRKEAEDYDKEFMKKHDSDLSTTLIFVRT